MSTYKVKLGATLSLSKERERDIVQNLEKLKSRHKLGEFISQSLRVVFENRELAEKCGLNFDRYGLTDNRKRFFDAVNTEVRQMNKKIDEIYNMAYKTYMLTQFNKKMGLEDKSKNLLQAQFILQKQTKEMCDILGIDNIGQIYESNKMYDLEKNVDETLEFIINYYDGIIQELKSNISDKRVVYENVSLPDDMEIEFGVEEVDMREEPEHIDANVKVKGETKEEVKDTEEEQEEVEFQTTDLGALLEFMG